MEYFIGQNNEQFANVYVVDHEEFTVVNESAEQIQPEQVEEVKEEIQEVIEEKVETQ